MTEQPVVAVLGTGIMGGPMARNMLAAGLPVRVWNRSTPKAEPLAAAGAQVAATPAEAVQDADIVVTMLADGDAVRETIEAALPALTGVWVQSSTIGTADTETLLRLARKHGVRYVDAPVLGTKQPAEQGELVVLESGDPEDCAVARPVFDAIGRRTTHVCDQPGDASKLKLVVNNWVLALTNATAETVALACHLELDPQLFLDAISGGGMDVPYAHAKGSAMITGEYPVSFPLSLAAKDARLVLDAAGERIALDGTRAALTHLEAACRDGHGEKDMGAVYHGVTR